jgi:hypothetical protein
MDQLKNLDLTSTMKPEDVQYLSQLLSQTHSLGKNKKSKEKPLTQQQRNALLAKLSSHQTIDESPKKIMSDMTEEEKKEYREELRKKLHQKQNVFKQQRTTKHTQKSNLDSTVKKITDSQSAQSAQTVGSNANTDNGIVEEIDASNSFAPVFPTLPKFPTLETNNNISTDGEQLEDFVN